MTKLIIDTSNFKETVVELLVNGKKHKVSKMLGQYQSLLLLKSIDKLLKLHKKKLENISEIRINTGPGSFTGLRVGLAVANTLSWLLDIPVNGKKEIVLPHYE